MTRTIKGEELKNLRRVISVGLRELGTAGRFESDTVGYAILDTRVSEVKVKIEAGGGI
jgi:hypothetical protein